MVLHPVRRLEPDEFASERARARLILIFDGIVFDS